MDTKKKLEAVRGEIGANLGLPKALWALCAFERNGHIHKRSWKQIYWLIMDKAASMRRLIEPRHWRRNTGIAGDAKTYLKAATLLRERVCGRPEGVVIYRTTSECSFLGMPPYPVGTRLTLMPMKDRDKFRRDNKFTEEYLNRYPGEFFKVGNHLFFLGIESYERIPTDQERIAA